MTILAPVAPSTDRTQLARVAAIIRDQVVQALPGLSVSVGISRLCRGPHELPRAYREARQALALGRELKGTGHITDFHELGSYRVLLSQGNRWEAESSCREIVGPREELRKEAPRVHPDTGDLLPLPLRSRAVRPRTIRPPEYGAVPLAEGGGTLRHSLENQVARPAAHL